MSMMADGLNSLQIGRNVGQEYVVIHVQICFKARVHLRKDDVKGGHAEFSKIIFIEFFKTFTNAIVLI